MLTQVSWVVTLSLVIIYFAKRDETIPQSDCLFVSRRTTHLAQYALESSSQPLGISEYELEKLYPEKVEGTMPSIKEIEDKLDGQTNC